MSEILKVLNRKSVELKSEVVEFATAKELIDKMDEGISLGDSMSKTIKIAKDLEAELKQYNETTKDHASDVIGLFKRVSKEYIEIINNYSDLGLKHPSSLDKKMKELEAFATSAKKVK
jgi:phage-related holin